MWVEISPRRPDFCGSPPCPVCYEWHDDSGVLPGEEKMALDLMQKPFNTLTKSEVEQVIDVGIKIHREGLKVSAEPPTEQPPPDIGMSRSKRLSRWLKLNVPKAPPPPRQLTCDEVIARQLDREADEKAKQEVREELIENAKEVAKAMKEVREEEQPNYNRNRRNQDSSLFNGIDPDFVRYCQSKGYSPEEVYRAWREYRMEQTPDYIIRGFNGRGTFGY
jgi:hypothetical protein